MTTHLHPVPLEEWHCRALGDRVREADRRDLLVHGSEPEVALLLSLNMGGDAYAVMDGPEVIGAGGWTSQGTVWTLWQDLSLSQAKALFRVAVPWSRIIAIRAKRPLSNVFLSDNLPTRRFLIATGCIDILEESVEWDGRQWTPFFLKPLERLPHV